MKDIEKMTREELNIASLRIEIQMKSLQLVQLQRPKKAPASSKDEA